MAEALGDVGKFEFWHGGSLYPLRGRQMEVFAALI